MMKLKYLFNNEALATTCLDNWTYDPASLDLFKYFRLSANAIYPFKDEDRLQYLRMSPDEEKDYESLIGEVELLTQLKGLGINVPAIIPSKEGQFVKKCETSWGNYYSVVFEGIRGNTLENTALTEDIIIRQGKLLGRVHKACQSIDATVIRPTAIDRLNWIVGVLNELPDESIAIEHAQQLNRELTSLPTAPEHFGLIHYDFELDNIILSSETGELYVIDFDDSLYGWYELDIMNALSSLEDECEHDQLNAFKSAFLKGYESETTYHRLTDEQRHSLKKFVALYKYTRIKRSIVEPVDNEPEWMTQLQSRLHFVSAELLKTL